MVGKMVLVFGLVMGFVLRFGKFSKLELVKLAIAMF
jgi:hypothetical protein